MTKPQKSYTMAAGLVWGGAMFVLTWVSLLTGGSYAYEFLQVMASIYPGYWITPLGSILGALYGFLDAYIGVYVFFWIANWWSKKK